MSGSHGSHYGESNDRQSQGYTYKVSGCQHEYRTLLQEHVELIKMARIGKEQLEHQDNYCTLLENQNKKQKERSNEFMQAALEVDKEHIEAKDKLRVELSKSKEKIEELEKMHTVQKQEIIDMKSDFELKFDEIKACNEPFLKIARPVLDRAREKDKRRNQRDLEVLEKGNRAAHGGQ